MADVKLSKMKEAFCLFDKDADGYIPAGDFGLVIRSLGVNPTQQEIDRLLLGREDSLLKFDEFLALAGDHVKKSDPENDLINAFKTFDRERTGCISSSELKHVMLNLGERLGEKDVDELLMIADATKSGKIKYKDFIQKLLSKPVS